VSLTTTDAADNVNVTQTSGSSTTGVSINVAGAHNHVISNQGGSLPHNNIQPTLFGGNVFILGQYVQTFTSNFSGILSVNL
jgi:microcystin-dependent protein